jgi:hypothetical protein
MNDRHTDQEFGIYHLSTKIGDTKIYSRFRGKMMINLGIPLTSHLDCHLQYPECLWKISKRLANDPPFSPIDPWKKAISRSHCMVLQENATDKIKISSCPRKSWLRCVPKFGEGSPHGNFRHYTPFHWTCFASARVLTIVRCDLGKVGAQIAERISPRPNAPRRQFALQTSTPATPACVWICTTYSKVSFGMILTCPHSFTHQYIRGLPAGWQRSPKKQEMCIP